MKDTTNIKYEATKSYNGFISIRSNIVDRAVAKGKNIVVNFKGQVMTIPSEYLKYAGQLHKKQFKSKFTGKDYELYDFWFIDDNAKKSENTLFKKEK